MPAILDRPQPIDPVARREADQLLMPRLGRRHRHLLQQPADLVDYRGGVGPFVRVDPDYDHG
jgi:hypothetical protein